MTWRPSHPSSRSNTVLNITINYNAIKNKSLQLHAPKLRYLLTFYVLDGQSLPTDVNPTSSAKKQPRSSSPKDSSKAVITTRQGSGRRTQEDIQKRLENDDDEPYKPKPGSKFEGW